MNSLIQVFYNIVGGILVALFIEAWVAFRRHYIDRKFRNLFGYRAGNQFFITYGLLQLDKSEQQTNYPFIKPGVEERFGNLSSVVSDAQTRGVSYLADAFGKNASAKPSIVSDVEIMDRLDLSFCSVGGRNNLKTRYVEGHEDNRFFKFDLSDGSIVGVKGNNPKFLFHNNFDYGFIIKLKPKNLQDKTWVAVAGLGEWGTSGAAWFLARNWAAIEKMYKDAPFALIIKVRVGMDESAEMVYRS